MTKGFVVRRTLDWEDGRKTFQWISWPGHRVVYYGKVKPKMSSNARLTQIESEAYVFSSRAAAQKSIDRYYGWIKDQFVVEKIS